MEDDSVVLNSFLNHLYQQEQILLLHFSSHDDCLDPTHRLTDRHQRRNKQNYEIDLVRYFRLPEVFSSFLLFSIVALHSWLTKCIETAIVTHCKTTAINARSDCLSTGTISTRRNTPRKAGRLGSFVQLTQPNK